MSDRLDYQADGAGLLGAVRAQVHVADVDGGACRQLTSGSEHAGSPAWSPDGTTLAFPAGSGQDSDLTLRAAAHVLNADDPAAQARPVAPSPRRPG